MLLVWLLVGSALTQASITWQPDYNSPTNSCKLTGAITGINGAGPVNAANMYYFATFMTTDAGTVEAGHRGLMWGANAFDTATTDVTLRVPFVKMMEFQNEYFARWIDVPGDMGTVALDTTSSRTSITLTYIAARGNANFPFRRDTNIKLTNFLMNTAANDLINYISLSANEDMAPSADWTPTTPYVQTPYTLDLSVAGRTTM